VNTTIFEHWARNLFPLLLFLGTLVVSAVLAVILFAYVRGVIWRAWTDYLQRRDARQKARPDGTPYPPAGRCLCDKCQKHFEQVYFLDSGTRLCPDCYRHKSED
jgi:hypothetical protein